MSRPSKHGGKAAKEMLDFTDHLLSQAVDLVSERLNFKQRYKLRIMVLKYVDNGDRRRSKDPMIQQCFREIVTRYIEINENF